MAEYVSIHQMTLLHLVALTTLWAKIHLVRTSLRIFKYTYVYTTHFSIQFCKPTVYESWWDWSKYHWNATRWWWSHRVVAGLTQAKTCFYLLFCCIFRLILRYSHNVCYLYFDVCYVTLQHYFCLNALIN